MKDVYVLMDKDKSPVAICDTIDKVNDMLCPTNIVSNEFTVKRILSNNIHIENTDTEKDVIRDNNFYKVLQYSNSASYHCVEAKTLKEAISKFKKYFNQENDPDLIEIISNYIII